ncbi:hypothetical protein T265_12929, partial [Opisthorchis viverrini]
VAADFHLCDENVCVLLHSPDPGGGILFGGTLESFENLRLQMATAESDLGHSSVSTPDRDILRFLCELCLDAGLPSCALNLALQLHSVARQERHEFPDTDSNGIEWMQTKSHETPPFSSYVSVDPTPVGLSAELWTRIVKICPQVSPLLAVVPAHCDPPPECCSYGENGSAACGENKELLFLEAPHFVKVHEFSAKEQQLLAHSLALHEQQQLSECEQQTEEKQLNTDLSSGICTDVSVQPVNDDYLAAVYDMTECSQRTAAATPRAELDATCVDGETTAVYQRASAKEQAGWDFSETLDDVPASTEPSPEDEQFFDSPIKEDSSLVRHRRTSILRCTDRSTLSPDGEHNRSVRKRVRFSLGAAHPSPALEAEYGGRSNRRRLIDFARRRQLLANGADASDLFPADNLYNVLFNTNYNPLFLVFRCTRYLLKLLHMLIFHARVQLFIWCSLLICLFFFATLLVCGSCLNMPWSTLFPPPSLMTKSWNDGAPSKSLTSEVCTRYFVWLNSYWTQWVGS